MTDPHPVRIEAPRVAGQLAPVDSAPLEEGDRLDGVLWTEPGPSLPAGDVEVTESRLVGVQLTGAEVDELTLVDTVVDDDYLACLDRP